MNQSNPVKPDLPANAGSGNFFRQEWPLLGVLLLPFIALSIEWSSLPAQVPMHFDSRGNVDSYGSPLQLLILPSISVIVALVLYFIPRLDPRRANIEASMPAYRWIRFWMATFFTYIFFLMLAASFHPALDVTPLIAIGLLALFFCIGFAMPKLKQNYMIGIRLPWTLESEDNWNRTHAFAGKLWPPCSLIGIALALIFQSASIFIAIGALILMVIVTAIYSFRIFREEKRMDF